jgi:hypothetical protein
MSTTKEQYFAIRTKIGFLAFDSRNAVWFTGHNLSQAYFLPLDARHIADVLAEKYLGTVVLITISVSEVET